ncbi:polysaccharide export protein [Lichenihabitans sp. PAMC28606]|uniref:polysaccharide biosynthesis/export family protein n=1 Tax=Lichenihabitans sp. PAMC28606 TaxID=2880932 RepID=UPI001D09FA95|nr:polysaccharide biosynthesis/export family protein [Lichenihabitans sp. PAMC28606]UDL95119.1 polysaccharide export protein [Lichenihabitans sp. PAMC28606]
MRRTLTAIGLALTVLTSGCAGQNFPTDLFRAQANAPYQLGSGDRLRIIVFGQDALSNSYSVSGAGTVSLPLAGDVRVGGLTTTQAERLIETRLRAGFLREPHVSVEVEAFRPFFILGEVTLPGQYPFVNGMTAQKAIAIAGGYTPRGFQGSVDVTRSINGAPVTGTVPLTFPIRPGDTLTVEERFF